MKRVAAIALIKTIDTPVLSFLPILVRMLRRQGSAIADNHWLWPGEREALTSIFFVVAERMRDQIPRNSNG